jgi:hypothetical protein
MANRNFNRLQSLDKEVKHLHAQVAIGASGAPTLSADSVGIQSITRDTAGVYDIVLQDQYVRLLGANVMQLVASPQHLGFQLEAQSVDASTRTVKLRCVTVATETDPASGSILYIQLVLKNSTAK